MLIFEERLSLILESNDDFDAAVAIVRHRGKWLLGLSTASDDRSKRWCFPGGGIKRGESPQQAAVRECIEETGIKCSAIGSVLTLKEKPKVAFIPCRAAASPGKFVPNSEFVALGFFQPEDFKALVLYNNVKDLINRSKKYY